MKTKLIFSPQRAQFLLHNGLKVVELKPKRNSINETVFVFQYDKRLNNLMEEWVNRKNDK